jgi:tripartite-type tricarboxylate transporter receptor subunit TctC
VKALGVTGAKPSRLLPGVATLSASYPGLVISNWYGLLAPARTPVAVVSMLQDEFERISADPDMERRMLDLGLEPAWISGADLSQRIAADIAKWQNFISATDIKAN